MHRNRNRNLYLAFSDGIHKCVEYHLATDEIPFDKIKYVVESSYDFGVTALPIKWLVEQFFQTCLQMFI
jgi:hypothetical protein